MSKLLRFKLPLKPGRCGEGLPPIFPSFKETYVFVDDSEPRDKCERQDGTD
jgi:hypothetical protein